MRYAHPFTMLSCQNRQYRQNRQFHKLLLLGVLTLFSGMKSAFPISLPEAVALAVHKSPEVLAFQKQRLILEQQVKQVYASYFPSIDLSTGFGNEQTSNVSTRRSGDGTVSLPRTEARVAINQMLFDGFAVSNHVKKAQADYKAADWVYQETVQSVALDAIRNFLDVQKQRALLGLIKKFSGVQARFADKVQAWYEGGAGTVADVWQIKSRLALTQSNVATSESQLGSAIDTFVRLFGFVPKALDPVPSVSKLMPPSIEKAMEKTERFHPSLMENRLNLEAAEAIQEASHSGFWPSVSLVLETNRTTNANGMEGKTQLASAMIRLNYNLFQGGYDLAASREARRRMEQVLAESEKIKHTSQENIEKSWRTIQELQKRLAFLKDHVTLSKQVVDAYYEQFFSDNRSLLNVLNAENELFNAQSNQVEGDYLLLVEEYRFLAHMGILNQVLAALPDSDAPKKKSAILGALFTSSKPINLYNTPGTSQGATKRVPKETPLRIIKTKNGWFHVTDTEGNRMWLAGPVAQNGEPNPDWLTGMITLDVK